MVQNWQATYDVLLQNVFRHTDLTIIQLYLIILLFIYLLSNFLRPC